MGAAVVRRRVDPSAGVGVAMNHFDRLTQTELSFCSLPFRREFG